MAAKNVSDFVDTLVPLILEHPDPWFDDLLSSWMGENIRVKYMRYKRLTTTVVNAPYELQLRYLITLWRADQGQSANLEGFLTLIKGKPFTTALCEKLSNEIDILITETEPPAQPAASKTSPTLLMVQHIAPPSSIHPGIYGKTFAPVPAPVSYTHLTLTTKA